MTSTYNSPGGPKATTADLWQTAGSRLINGVDTAYSHFSGTTDPSTGGTWVAGDVGTLWFDTTNELGAGDGLGGQFKRYWKTATATPTFAFVDMKLRGYYAASPVTSTGGINLSGSSAVAFTDHDVSGATTSDRAVAVKLLVSVTCASVGSGYFIEFRKNGVTTDSITPRVYPQVAGIPNFGEVTVDLDSSGVFEYALNCPASTATATVAIAGYWERR